MSWSFSWNCHFFSLTNKLAICLLCCPEILVGTSQKKMFTAYSIESLPRTIDNIWISSPWVFVLYGPQRLQRHACSQVIPYWQYGTIYEMEKDTQIQFISLSIYWSIYLSIFRSITFNLYVSHLSLPRACHSIHSLYVYCIIVNQSFSLIFYQFTTNFLKKFAACIPVFDPLLPQHHVNIFSNILLKGPSNQRRSAPQRYV